MPIPFLNAVDLNKNELQNAKIQNLAADPGTPVAGQVYFNTVSLTLKYYTGSTWVTLGRLDQTSAPTGDVNVNSQKITNVGAPSAATDAATKGYVDSTAQGLDIKQSVRAATTAAGTLATSFANGQTIDGIVLVTNDRILIKNQAAPAENGIYTVNASGAPTRALDFDAWAEVPGAFVFVEVGTTLADTGWVCSADGGGTMGTTAITFVQFSSAGIVTASGGLTKTGNDIAMTPMPAHTFKGNNTGSTAAPADLTITQMQAELQGAAILPALTGDVTSSAGSAATTIAANAVSNTKLADMAADTIKGRANGGGSGDPQDLTAAQVRTILGITGQYAASFGDGSSLTYTITHNLGSRDVQVQVYRVASPYETVWCDVERTDTNNVLLRFAVAPTANQYRVVIK